LRRYGSYYKPDERILEDILSAYELFQNHENPESFARETDFEVIRGAESKSSECSAPAALLARCELLEGGLGI
jgi:hypothetical protein